MEETQQRLKETAEACIKAYETWGTSKKDGAAREHLQEALHELRKVAARVEIEMAASEREETNQRQIPIPPHRASRQRHAESGNDLPDFITADSNHNSDDDQGHSQNQGRPQNRGPGGPRRTMRRPHGPRQGGGQNGPAENAGNGDQPE